VTKFSGTDQAGLNTNLAGMTADAFAHFSLHDSDGNFVLVDIQGGKDLIYFTMEHILTFLIPRYIWECQTDGRKNYWPTTCHLVRFNGPYISKLWCCYATLLEDSIAA